MPMTRIEPELFDAALDRDVVPTRQVKPEGAQHVGDKLAGADGVSERIIRCLAPALVRPPIGCLAAAACLIRRDGCDESRTRRGTGTHPGNAYPTCPNALPRAWESPGGSRGMARSGIEPLTRGFSVAWDGFPLCPS
jgi:hypothetical protein